MFLLSNRDMRVYRALESAVKTTIADALRYQGWVLNNVASSEQRQKLKWVAVGLFIVGLWQAWQAWQAAVFLAGAPAAQSPQGYIWPLEREWWGIASLAVALSVLFAASLLVGGSDWARRLGMVTAGVVAFNQAIVFPEAPWWAVPILLLALVMIVMLMAIKPSESVVSERIPVHGGGARGVR